MTQDKTPFTLQRILVPLDASEHSLAALHMAVELAAAQDAELEGLFVEDIHLLQLSEFPFAREVSFFGPSFRRIERADTERQLRVRAQRLQRVVADVARRHNVRWKFRVTRGGVPTEVLAAAEKADLTILGRAGWSMPQGRKVGSTVRTVITHGRGMALIIQHGMRFQAPIQVMFTGTALAEKALSVAVDLGRTKDLTLLVYIVAEEANRQGELEQRAKDMLAGHGLQARFQVMQKPALPQLSKTVRSFGSGACFIPCEEPYFSGQHLQDLVSSLPNPLFLVRQRAWEE